MAWAERRGKTWRAAWRDANGKEQYEPGFTHKKLAERHAFAEEERARQTSPGVDAKATFGSWLDRWLKIRNVEASTDKKDRERIELHVRPKWGATPVRKITKLDAEEWVSELDELVAPGTVRKIWFNFATPLRWAHERGAALMQPPPYLLSKGTLPTPSGGHERYLARNLLEPLERELGTDDWDLLPATLLFGTGMRFGEMAGLHRERVDLDRGMVHILETWSPAGGYIKGYPKSQKGRHVPLPDWLCELLVDRFDRVPDAGTCERRHAGGTTCSSSLVITGERGGPLNREHYGELTFKPALARIGVTGLRIHDTRHTYASWLLQAGHSLSEVSELLGHNSIVVTQKYTHLGGSHWDGVRATLNREQSGRRVSNGGPPRSAAVLHLVPSIVRQGRI